MSPDRSRVEQLFEAALALPPETRRAFLTEAAGADPELLREVDALLAAHERSAGVLDDAPAGAAAAWLGLQKPDALPADARIGPYRILGELGRGGMGVVYLAERADGQFRRRVAVKILRGDPDRDVLARIRAERQILASLDHPNIARLLDGGITTDGRPYLVMTHVDGLPINVFCDRMRLGIRERLAIFATVAGAVEHAHHNLIVHRDLKPSNILVTTDGQPHLLDFGIAKLLNPTLTGGDAPVTGNMRQVLTPEYASPEQLRGESLSTASDVYSLGVVLYQLLTGRLPHTVDNRSVGATLERVLGQEPLPPSRQVTRSATASAPIDPGHPGQLATDRGTTPQRLRRELAGDLDAIVLMALRKEPHHRYPSAEALSQDIQRYLDGRPVQARRGSGAYRLRKAIRRHRGQAAAVAVGALALLLGAATAAWQADVAHRERDRTEAALRQAEAALAESAGVTEFLMELFRAGDPTEAGAGQVTARDLMRRGALRVEEMADRPLVQARILDAVGQVEHNLGAFDEAQSLLERGLALRRAELGDSAPEVAESLMHLGLLLNTRARYAAADVRFQEALAIRKAALGEMHPAVAETYLELALNNRRGDERREYFHRAIGIQQTSLGREHPEVALTLRMMGSVARAEGDIDFAEELFREALRINEGAYGPDHLAVAGILIHLGDLLREHRGELDEAERLYRRALAIQTRRLGEDHVSLVHVINSLAHIHAARDLGEGAEGLLRRSLAIISAAMGAEHRSTAAQLEGIATELERQGRLAEAEQLQREAVAIYRDQLGRHPTTAGGMRGLATLLVRRGGLDEAAALQAEAEAIYTAVLGVGSIHHANLQREVGDLLVRRGDHQGAEAAYLRSLALLRRSFPEEHLEVQMTRDALAAMGAAVPAHPQPRVVSDRGGPPP